MFAERARRALEKIRRHFHLFIGNAAPRFIPIGILAFYPPRGAETKRRSEIPWLKQPRTYVSLFLSLSLSSVARTYSARFARVSSSRTRKTRPGIRHFSSADQATRDKTSTRFSHSATPNARTIRNVLYITRTILSKKRRRTSLKSSAVKWKAPKTSVANATSKGRRVPYILVAIYLHPSSAPRESNFIRDKRLDRRQLSFDR